MLIKRIIFLTLLISWVSYTWGEAIPGPKEEIKFLARNMKTVILPLQNPDFGETSPENIMNIIKGWGTISPLSGDFRVKLGEGRNGGRSVSVIGLNSILGNGEAHELYQDVSIKWLLDTTATLSLSAWVWSDASGGAFLKLSNLKGQESYSAFHSGASRWENLTVVYPYDQRPDVLRVSLLTTKGTSSFEEIKPIVTYDDRFTKTLPDACAPLRERVTYANDDRIRIVVVGNSTVNGHAVANKRASFPYVLQLKLETYFPGRFEVINFGICAWHLPPQIITLDKAFNSNKACDGAAWCAGKNGQFSHKAILVAEQNADKNTPTISQLKPDVIIFAGMWNDVWRSLKYSAWGIPPNPDEVNRNGETPSSVAYLQAVFNYADNPTKQNYQIADEMFEKAMRPVEPSTLASLQLSDYTSLRKSTEFNNLVENSSRKFRYLSEEFIRRAQHYADVWTATLPGRLGDSYEEAGKKLNRAGLLPAEKIDNFLMNGYVDALTERIQNRELTLASSKLGANLLDLSKSFQQQYEGMSISEQFTLGYFLENIEDNVHFLYRGNQWIADQMFFGFLNEFIRLSKNKKQSTLFK
jgi:hypothetical protein